MNRRSFLRGLTGLLAAPAIVRAASLMPVKNIAEPYWQVIDASPMTTYRWGDVITISEAELSLSGELGIWQGVQWVHEQIGRQISGSLDQKALAALTARFIPKSHIRFALDA